MAETKYPFRDSLRRAQDIYLEAVSDFIEVRLGNSPDGVLDFGYISKLFRDRWYDNIEGHFRSVDEYYEARSVVQLIVEGRNKCSHPPWDLDKDYVRTHLFIIAEFLGKIDRNLDQQEVNTIIEELYYDDTPERLEESERQVEKINSEIDNLVKNNKKLSDDLEIKEIQLSELELKMDKLKSDITRMSQEKIEKNQKLKTTTTQLKNSKERLKKSTDEVKQEKEMIASLQQQIVSMETEHNENKTTLRKQLSTKTKVIQENKDVIESLSSLLSVITLNQPNDTIFPQVNTTSSVRIIDQRNTNRKNYVFNLLKMKEPSIYYVKDVDQMYQYLTENMPEVSDLIEKHKQETSKQDEKELLVRLEEGNLKTIVSNSTVSVLPKIDCKIHILFCHLSPGIDVFINRCQPAFLSESTCFLHLIYDSDTDMDIIMESYPDRDIFNGFYVNLKGIDGIESNFIPTNNILNKLDMQKQTFDPICNIFQDIGMIEKNKYGVKLLSGPKKKLEESTVFNNGIKNREKFQEFYDFQKRHSCIDLWDKIAEKTEISNILKDYDNTTIVKKSEIEEKLEAIESENTDSSLE